jgi:predicted DCC family thiol-disulfide oxidoreductase YuxK
LAPYISRMTDLTVWFDGGCPLCRREIALMQRLDKRGAIAFVDVSDEATSCPLDRRELLARFHASEDGQIVSGAAAFAAMWRAIPMLRPLGILARNRVGLAILERFYLGFLKLRPRLQRLAAKLDQGKVAARS